MYTQILSKNELVINAEEEKEEEEEDGKKRKQKQKKRMDVVNTEKSQGKTGGTLLNYQQIPLPCLRNKTNARQKKSTKTTEKKVRAER